MNVDILFPVSIALFVLAPVAQAATHAKVMDYLATEKAKRDVAVSPLESVETSYFTERSVLEDAKLHERKKQVIACGEQFIRWFGVPHYPLDIEKAWINV